MNAKTKSKYTFTLKKAISAYDKHAAPWWVKLAFKYFSESTEKENMKPSNIITGILLSLFFMGFLATVFKLPRAIIGPLVFAYAGILFILVSFLFLAVFANNRRIKKVTKELGCTLQEWNEFLKDYKDELK